MIDTDDPQHWPGDSGAVIDVLRLPIRPDLPLFTADDIRALLIAEPYTAVSTRQYPDYTYVSQLP